MPWSGNKAPDTDNEDIKALALWVEDEFERFATDQLENVVAVELRKSYQAPLRPATGMIIYPDGTTYNPGSGERPYWRSAAGLWVPVASVTDLATRVSSVKKQIFFATGTYTPSTGMLYCIIECIGVGAGGGGVLGAATGSNGGGGGGGGSYSRLLATAATIGASKAVTIGAKGLGGAAGNNNGTAGGDTSVGTLCIAKGGSPGLGANGTANFGRGGLGGVAGTGDFSIPGEAGGDGVYTNAATLIIIGAVNKGGDSGLKFGAGGKNQNPPNGAATAGTAGSLYGGGGAGGIFVNSATNAAGADGTLGLVVITEFCNV